MRASIHSAHPRLHAADSLTHPRHVTTQLPVEVALGRGSWPRRDIRDHRFDRVVQVAEVDLQNHSRLLNAHRHERRRAHVILRDPHMPSIAPRLAPTPYAAAYAHD